MIQLRRLAVAALACSLVPVAPAAAGAVDVVRARGKLVVLGFPHQESDFLRVDVEVGLGHYDGIDVDLMRGFADSLGVQLEIRPVKPAFAALVPQLLDGKGDVVASYFTITPERRKQVAFSSPYFAVRNVVVTPRAVAAASVGELAGKTGTTLKGTSFEEIMKRFPGVRFHYVDFVRWTYDAMTEGKADYALLDSVSVLRILPLYPQLKVAFELPGESHYGFAVAPGSDLVASLDRYLEEVKRNGKLDEIVRRHLGESATSGVSGAPR